MKEKEQKTEAQQREQDPRPGRAFRRSWRWQRLRKWLADVKPWQWLVLALVLVGIVLLCVWFLPWLGRWQGLDGSGLWDGLERFGGIVGLVTVVFAILSFWNTRRILEYRSGSYYDVKKEQSDEAFDVFVRVKASARDSANMEAFLNHCVDCCPENMRSWPRAQQNGREIHLAQLFADNNEKKFESTFHRELFETFGSDGLQVKQRFEQMKLEPVQIYYGFVAIRENKEKSVYFKPKRDWTQQRVAGERIVKINFPMDLPADDEAKRQAFVAYFVAVMQLLFKYFHNIRLCYQGPTLLPCILGYITDNVHVMEGYQYDATNNCYYRVGSSDPKILIDEFLDTVQKTGGM